MEFLPRVTLFVYYQVEKLHISSFLTFTALLIYFSYHRPLFFFSWKLTLLIGQPMSITFDTMPPRAPRRSASVPTTASLLNRIQKPPLVERLSRDDSTIKAPSGPYVIVHLHFFCTFLLLAYLGSLSFLDALLREDPSVADLLVVVEAEVVPTPTPTSPVHPKGLKSQRLLQNSIKN